MSNVRFLACISVFFFSCASSRPANSKPAAPQGVVAVPKILLPATEHWTLTFVVEEGENVIGMTFTHLQTKAQISALILEAVGQTADQSAAEIAWLHGAGGHEVYGIERAINGLTLATAMWRGTRADTNMRGKFGVRSTKKRPDLLLVIKAKWPKGTPQAILDQIDLMILLATIE